MQAERVYRLLVGVGNPAADAVLIGALGVAEPAYRPRIVRMLLDRGTHAAHAGLVEHYDELDEGCREILTGHGNRFEQIWRQTIRHESETVRRNTVAMISDLEDTQSAYVLASALHAGDEETRQAGGQTLVEMCHGYLRLRNTAQELLDVGSSKGAELMRVAGRQRGYLLSAVEEGLQTFQTHKRIDLVTAFAILADEFPPEIWGRVDQLGQTFTKPLLGMASGRWNRTMVGVLVSGLHCESLRAGLLRTWADAADRKTFQLLVSRFHALTDMAICQGIHGLRTQHFLTECTDRDFLSLGEEAQLQVLQFVQHTGLDEELKLRIYRMGVTVGVASVQTEAIWQLRNLKLHDPIRALKWAMTNSRGAVREVAAEALRQLQEEVA